jgi:cysteine desulfurase/selenocysteine lyase
VKVLGAAAAGVERAALLGMALSGCDDLGDVARMLSDAYGVMCRSGHLCAQPLVDALHDGEVLRFSAYIYNTEDEIRGAFTALDEIHALLER